MWLKCPPNIPMLPLWSCMYGGYCLAKLCLPTMMELHLLPMQARTTFKAICIIYKSIIKGSPAYLVDKLTIFAGTWHTCHQAAVRLKVKMCKKEYNRRQQDVSICALRIWNDIPLSMKTAHIHVQFRKALMALQHCIVPSHTELSTVNLESITLRFITVFDPA